MSARRRCLKVHQISEEEFNQLVTGANGQLDLNFALALLPAALTMLITLQTVDITNNRTYYTYLVALIAFAAEGLYHLTRW